MKQDFENNFNGYKLPYHESEEYVKALIERCADNAITASEKRNDKKQYGLWNRLNYRVVAVAASVVAIVCVALGLILNESSKLNNSLYASLEQAPSFEDMLVSLSDEQMEMLSYAYVEIPDYTNE